jgi:hypothetical protein
VNGRRCSIHVTQRFTCGGLGHYTTLAVQPLIHTKRLREATNLSVLGDVQCAAAYGQSLPLEGRLRPGGRLSLVLTKHAGGKAASSAAQGMARSPLNRCHMAIIRSPREQIWQITDDSEAPGIPAKSDRPHSVSAALAAGDGGTGGARRCLQIPALPECSQTITP